MQESISSLYPQFIVGAASGFFLGTAMSISSNLIPTMPLLSTEGTTKNRSYPGVVKAAVRTGIISAILWPLMVYPLWATGNITRPEITKFMIQISLLIAFASPILEIMFAATPKIVQRIRRSRSN